jgi:RNA polymerase sigma factor
VERLLLVLFRRWFGKSRRDDGPASRELPEAIVARIRSGEEKAIGPFLAAYEPFIIKVASRFCRRYIDPSLDDEYSVALQGFHEAIRQYDAEAGKSFIGFAETVIRRRLIDHLRKEQRHARILPYSSLEGQEEEGRLRRLEDRQSMRHYALERERQSLRQEIEELGAELSDYGISYTELAKHAPKHADSRENMQRIAKGIAEDAELMTLMRKKKQLPIKEILAFAGVTRKTLERNRKYLIALVLIRTGVYLHLQDYLGPDAENGKGGKEA